MKSEIMQIIRPRLFHTINDEASLRVKKRLTSIENSDDSHAQADLIVTDKNGPNDNFYITVLRPVCNIPELS